MPRHWRSGWHRMCPKSAFHDQNFLPHSLQGRVIFGAVGSGFFVYLGFMILVLESAANELLIRINLLLFFRGFWWCLGAEWSELKAGKIS